MADIKLIKKDTDLTNKLEKMNWDAWYGIIPLDVYRIDDFYHSIGGHWGNNNYWACKRGVNPNYETLMQFNGEPCSFSFKVESNNYYRCKYDTSIEHNFEIIIYRNNEEFYSFKCHDIDYGISKARLILFRIKEHPINFYCINWVNEIIGREIMWNRVNCIIESYSDGNVIIKPNLKYTTKEKFLDACMFDNKNDKSFEYIINEDIFADSIFWFNVNS